MVANPAARSNMPVTIIGSAETIGNGAAKDAEPLLQQLAQTQRDADDQRRPLIDRQSGSK